MLWTGKLQKKKTIKPSPSQLSTYKNACASLVRIITLDNYYRRKTVWSKERTIRKLMGGGGGRAKYNKILAQGKIKWKKLCMPINPQKYSCYGLKKIHTRNLITKKNSCGWKIPQKPLTLRHNFSNGQSLIHVISFSRCASSCSLYLFPFSFGSSPDKSQYDLSIFCRSPPGIKAEIL